jgi:hypothetical protein
MMTVPTMLTAQTTLMTGRSDFSGACSIALLPFWCLDAKGGEVVLLGISRDLHGWGTQACAFIIPLALVFLLIYLL